MNTPVKVAQMTPAEDKRGVRVEVDVLHLDEIPKAMDNMGWTVSAQLMRRWFATKPSWEMPVDWRFRPPRYAELPESRIDDKIVKMSWAMQPKFTQVHAALARLRQAWNSPEGIKVLIEKLERGGWKPGKSQRLGARIMTAKQLDDECQVNALPFGGEWDTLNDYFGAIFKATLKIAVIGKAYRSLLSGKDLFEVEQIGFYIRDTYDFNSGWIDDATMGLGVWSKQRLLTKAEMVEFKAFSSSYPAVMIMRHLRYPSFVPLQNSNFRQWQHKHDTGGDFFIFSDVLWENYLGPLIELS